MTTLNSSYIDAADLHEVLTDYFNGSLDNVDEYLSRLYKGLLNLHPSNTLHGQLYEGEVDQCISKLSTLEKAALEYKFQGSDKAKAILTRYYLNDSSASNFDNFAELAYLEAINHLSFEILQIL